VKLTTHLHAVPEIRIRGFIPLLLQTHEDDFTSCILNEILGELKE
jgi:hypothetical protein